MKKISSLLVCVFILVILIGSISFQDKSLFYKQMGEGETIIFVHGSQEDYRVFIPQLELLSKDFHVVTYSRRYNYPNNHLYKEGTPFTPMTEAEDLEKLRQQLGIENFNLVGHSYGGLIALAYANKYQNRLKSITVSEPPLLSMDGCEESLTSSEDHLKRLKTTFETSDTTAIMATIFEFFVGQDIQDQIPPESLQALKENLPEMEALANSENPFPALNAKFDFPTMIITSENEMPLLECANASLIDSTPEARHVSIPGASHDMWMTHPEVMSNHVKDFVLNN